MSTLDYSDLPVAPFLFTLFFSKKQETPDFFHSWILQLNNSILLTFWQLNDYSIWIYVYNINVKFGTTTFTSHHKNNMKVWYLIKELFYKRYKNSSEPKRMENFFFWGGGGKLFLFYDFIHCLFSLIARYCCHWLITVDDNLSNAGTRPSPHFYFNFHPTVLFPFDIMPTPASIFSQFLTKLQTSFQKITASVHFRTDLGVVDIRYQIQSLQTSAVLLAGHHQLRIHNQFFCLASTKTSYRHLLSRSKKCWQLFGTFLMGWTPVKLSKINN